MEGIKSLGTLIIQAFQKIPGVDEILKIDNGGTWSLVAGIITIICYILGLCVAIIGIVRFVLKKVESEKNGNSNTKSAGSFLVGGLVGGGVLVLLPSIILIIGTAIGAVVTK